MVTAADEPCPGQRVIDLLVETDFLADDVILIDNADRGTREIDGANFIREIFEGIGALPGLGLRGVTVPLNWVSGPQDNYAIAAHGLGSMAVQVTLTSNGTLFLAPWLVLDENRVEVHVSHSFTGPASAMITGLL
jgi:hypothetical protein